MYQNHGSMYKNLILRLYKRTKLLEKNLLVFLNNKLFKNTDIFFITKNKYNINFINNIYFILPEKRTEKYFKNIIQKWLLQKINKNIRLMIRSELHILNFNFSYKGTSYIIDILEYLYSNNIFEDNINFQKVIYPYLSKKYNRSISSIKSSILNSIEDMYYGCDVNTFKEYFCVYEDYRIKTKELIFFILNKIHKKPLLKT